jgi:Flp pilus assembly protein TadD
MEQSNSALRRGLAIAERHLELNPDDARAWYLGAGALIQLGQPDRAREWIRRARAIDPEDQLVLYNVACDYALLGELEEAMTCLEQALLHGFGHKEWLERDSYLDALRPDPRFQALLKKV